MTLAQFCESVYIIGKQNAGSVTSWGRSEQHSKAVGGFAGDPHTWWLGADMIYDSGPNLVTEGCVLSPRSCPKHSTHGLKCIHEKGHDHYQPYDFPAGVATKYP